MCNLTHNNSEIVISDVTTGRPVFGFDLEEHLKTSERSISYVIEECCLALRKEGMDSEGIFRLAASAAKLKLLKVSYYLVFTISVPSIHRMPLMQDVLN